LEAAIAERVGKRMDLELQADLDDVEGSNHETVANISIARKHMKN
jgi:hypothetical protein